MDINFVNKPLTADEFLEGLGSDEVDISDDEEFEINTWGLNSFNEYCDFQLFMKELKRKSFERTLEEVELTKQDLYSIPDEFTALIELGRAIR